MIELRILSVALFLAGGAIYLSWAMRWLEDAARRPVTTEIVMELRVWLFRVGTLSAMMAATAIERLSG